MKYQSELIKEIVDKRGHKFPSLHYQSECVESWIEEAKGSYPKLCDYEGEWLNYIVESPIGEFPYVTLSDVTEATVNNVVPYEYKSAILKGQTLVNLIDNGSERKEITYSGGTKANYRINKDMLVANKTYLLLFTVTDFSGDAFLASFNKSDQYGITRLTDIGNGLFKAKVNFSDLTSVTDTLIIYKVTGATLGGYAEKVMLIPYQEEMENWDIPYFTGMQSVQMPVLTTTGKNLFKGFTKYDYSVDNGVTIKEITDNSLTYITYIRNTSIVFYIPIDGDKNYIMSADMTNVVADDFYFVDELKQIIGTKFSLNKCVTSPTNAKFIKWHVRNALISADCLISNFQLEENSVTTTYEPYKSNILTVNEDVTLRSNGRVYDELDLLTGKLTQRIDEDGSVLTQEVVKTVDLTIEDQNGNALIKIKPIEGTMHLSTDGETIKPTFTGEIPVEAITQNLASFIEE